MVRRRSFVIVILAISFLALLGLYLEKNSRFTRLKTFLQSDSISTDMLNYGAMGKIFKRMDYVRITSNSGERFKKSENNQKDIERITFQKKRKVGDFLYQATPSRLKDAKDQKNQTLKNKPHWPIVSITIDDEYLYDPKIGILVNREHRDNKWERKAHVEIIKNNHSVFRSAIGLRVHGGRRLLRKPYNGFRLYFREEFGAVKLPDNLLFDNKNIPIRTLVLQTTDWPNGFPMNNPLAYDLADHIGCVSPQTQLVEIYLNNRSLGMGYATEHQSRKQWQHHVGHKEFGFYKYKSKVSEKDKLVYHDYFWNLFRNPNHLLMSRVAEKIDLENLSLQIITWGFCGTTDYCQGTGVVDLRDPKAKLHWIIWDMDHSFYDFWAAKKKRKIWEQDGFRLLYGKGGSTCGRTVLFTKLLDKSDEYRNNFIKLATEILNHKLTQEFLQSRVDYYKMMLKNFGKPHEAYIDIMRQFMRERPDFFRKEMAYHLKLSGPYRVDVSFPDNRTIEVDGYPYQGSYSGQYFHDFPCVLDLKGENSKKFLYWLVDGKRKNERSLTIQVRGDVTVEAVFDD